MIESYLTRVARIAGPLCISAAIWCAAGDVSVLSSGQYGSRVVAPAPWWVWLVGVVVAFSVPAWRKTPITTAPALLTLLPWLPLPLPAIALIWTGPLAWIPVAGALAAAVGSGALGQIGRRVGADVVSRGPWLAALATLLLGSATWWSLDPRLPGGDEPNYLVITQSLIADGDLRIGNNFAQRDYAEYFDGDLPPDYINRGKDGEIYSIHAPGVSALVLPAFAVAGLRGAQATILLCLVLTAAVVWRTCWLATRDTSAAWFAWAAVFAAPTTLLLGVMVFPDSPAALGTAIAAWLLVSLAVDLSTVSRRFLVLTSVALAALPWLHTRFAVIAALAGSAIVVALALARGHAVRTRLQHVATFLVVPAVSAGLWFWSFFAIYGTFDPRAPYRGAEQIREWIWGAVVGLYADQQFGLLAFAPVLVAGLVGACRAADRPMRRVCVALMGTLFVYTVAVASYHMWWAGLPGLPARFLTAVVPLLAVPLALGWHRATSAGRTVLLTVLAVSWGITTLVVSWDHGAFGFNDRYGQAAWLEWLNPLVNLPRAWPSFFWRTQAEFLWHVAAWLGVWVLAWVPLRIYLRRHADRADRGRVGVVLWLLLGFMTTAEIGWRLSDVSGVDPARSQLAVVAHPALWQVGALSVSRVEPTQVVVRADESPLSDAPSPYVLVVGPVAPGEYTLDVSGAPDAPLPVAIRACRRCTPLTSAVVQQAQPVQLLLSLPLGAASLIVEVDRARAVDARQLSATVRPRVITGNRAESARASVTRGETTVWFADEHAFVEGDGFWVRGGAETTVAFAAGRVSAGRTRPLVLRNGGSANDVTVTMGTWSTTVSLAAWQEQVITLPVADAAGAWTVHIRSSSGFRPSEVSGGDDRRFLGVWVPY